MTSLSMPSAGLGELGERRRSGGIVRGIYFDEGQLGWANGFCYPIRFESMKAAGTIPEDVLAKLPSTEGAYFPSIEDINAAKAIISEGWPEVVGVEVLPSQ